MHEWKEGPYIKGGKTSLRVTAFKNVLIGVGLFISCGTLTSFAQEVDLELDEALETASSTQEGNIWQHQCGDEIVPEGLEEQAREGAQACPQSALAVKAA
mgnify:CR=1 FL=1